METGANETAHRPKWKKVAYGGMQPGYADNYTDDSFLEEITYLSYSHPVNQFDSIWALTVSLLLVHLFLHDYSGLSVRAAHHILHKKRHVPVTLYVFVLLLALLVFVSVVCPYWLIRIQEYKFEINGPWDEAKLCFDISE
uniref:Uncharacterized protein n=1 Tax=Ananas comosus var. bracteatus TaxID=296719 RepID=A0A6V7QKM1_ANACO|nr:unnamed protein product [Ananas comosus var. bracteatus]